VDVASGYCIGQRWSRTFIFKSILTAFELSVVFLGGWGSREYWLKSKTRPPKANIACPKKIENYLLSMINPSKISNAV